MCKNLYSRIKDACHCSYYRIVTDVEELFKERKKCIEFIGEHFKKGRKNGVIEIPWKDKYTEYGKHEHTISLYLIGLLFESYFKDALKSKFERLFLNVGDWYNFKYTWFLTCMYHDFASSFEKLENCSQGMKGIDFYLGDFNIEYTPFNHKPMKPNVRLNRFSEYLIKNYFEYRMSKGEREHGIIAGYYYFDRLCKSYYSNIPKNYDFNVNPEYIEDGISWRSEHLDHFAYICDAIISHNIWLTKKSAKEYREYGLSCLIVDENIDIKLNFNRFPLQFLLCLFDTIEPVKKMKKGKEALNLYKNLDMYSEKKDDRISLVLSWTGCFHEYIDGFESWKNNILSLGKWMDIKVIHNANENKIELSFILSDA